eukprot:CAMPEP_0196656586 /NCGR_PEP_ID=MMETSP1086-20130531/18456_1 /TAXON_ID=77921 /ORGANISM="Cyanoptyche  gloeocystis , Strain SAG4.97" /LENGTH=318 /DNA_ID=CAMNT_0041989407 /DNA_START=23 /DNA_END=979 /DNA_ORIENTATION=+
MASFAFTSVAVKPAGARLSIGGKKCDRSSFMGQQVVSSAAASKPNVAFEVLAESQPQRKAFSTEERLARAESVHRRRFFAAVAGVAAAVAVSGQANADDAPKWGYSGEAGPTAWAEQFPACAGVKQSPIDIETTGALSLPIEDLKFSYASTPVSIKAVPNNKLVAFSNASNALKLGSKKFSLLQFHLHTPSEHTISGEPYPAELHLVHKDDDGNLAVVGIFLKEGKANSSFEPVLKQLAAEDPKSFSLNPVSLLPSSKSIYSYSGSLTTPPCSEGVSWLVVKTPIEVSAEQISTLKSAIGTNARPVQPVGPRTLINDI